MNNSSSCIICLSQSSGILVQHFLVIYWDVSLKFKAPAQQLCSLWREDYSLRVACLSFAHTHMHRSTSSSGSVSALVFQPKVRREKITVCLYAPHKLQWARPSPVTSSPLTVAAYMLHTCVSVCVYVCVQIERWLKSSFMRTDSVSIHFKPSALFLFCSGALLISWLESLLFLILSFFYLFLPTPSFFRLTVF